MDIQPDKYYSVREAAKLIPGIKYSSALQKLIDLDIKETNGKIFKAKVLKRNKQRRYFIKGEDLMFIIENDLGNRVSIQK
jgi:hypothetical protein